MPPQDQSEPFPWHLGVYDAHCHPTDTMTSIRSIPSMRTKCLTVMGTRAQDQALVAEVADTHGVKSGDPGKWPSDEYPTPFSKFLAQTGDRLERYPYALVGEIGLDRSFRIPFPWRPEEGPDRDESLTPGGREGRRLTAFRCNQKHQKAIYKKQLQLAAEYRRAVSIHGVQAHGMVYDALKELWQGHEKEILSKRELKRRGADHQTAKDGVEAEEEDLKPRPYPPRICLHSYSGGSAHLNSYFNPAIPVDIFVSFSTAINLGDALENETPESFVEMIKTVPDHRLLVESDLHTAGEEMDRRLEDIVKRVCGAKGWGLEEGVERLGKNWRRFAFGTDG
ncbi:Metallo-dependent hydrolase [Massarina eburnea CBS 473.64]|uniref:Metallo-dependent hydrolase n=1 Tax=Massarina eburnea CBS 473.64 TaxID=1395130 RepID=A0A6A6RWV4_9PLEO|nr:Metallo-dependent hydrolase [Massarina eburnea CBS 473.64]